MGEADSQEISEALWEKSFTMAGIVMEGVPEHEPDEKKGEKDDDKPDKDEDKAEEAEAKEESS